MYDIEAFYTRLNALLRERKTTQDWLCAECNINIGTFRNRVSKERLPDVFEALRIARALGVSVEYLVTGEERGGLTADAVRLAQKIEVLSPDQRQAVETTVDAFLQAARQVQSEHDARKRAERETERLDAQTDLNGERAG